MTRFRPADLRYPIVQAPMGGGASTPALAAAVAGAGGLGFLAAGYRSPDAVRADIAELRGHEPFGVNVFAPPGHGSGADRVAEYTDRLRPEAERLGVEVGRPRWDDDSYADKLDLLCAEPVQVVSFTFGCPSTQDVHRLQQPGIAVWVTVTTRAEALTASAAGVDGLVVQGVEAGGHRGSFEDTHPGDVGLIALLQLVRAAAPDLDLIASGGIATGAGVAAVLAAGAAAAQLGTAFLRCPEAGTSAAHRSALEGDRPTSLTRAFTGRTARGIVNRFMTEHDGAAPSAYPEVHHLTAPLRAAARQSGDSDSLHLWAGQAYPLASELPAAQVVQHLVGDARTALRAAATRLPFTPEAAARPPRRPARRGSRPSL